MHRALSWPLLAGCSPAEDEDGRGAALSSPPVVVVQALQAVPLAAQGQQQQQARRLLCRHYYPEGGWGWVIVVCCATVHLLAGGLQLSWAVLLAPTARRFDTPTLHTGKTCPEFTWEIEQHGRNESWDSQESWNPSGCPGKKHLFPGVFPGKPRTSPEKEDTSWECANSPGKPRTRFSLKEYFILFHIERKIFLTND
ncbi:NADH-quinone oxidoreductase subunit A [Frankliniella fusca]|uniref:NADH-quinone oxidoreductase subunit A n=1 Tax=Frankliniella fusca TaxID=407009 RepID=A0AAE1HKK5_9NEOP|nr:NADH-quinone oxidoreductase subunit A [Frankliniella fusca]